MRTSATGLEPRLAWAILKEIEELSDLLWERYEKDFLDLYDEESSAAELAKNLEPAIEIPF